MTRDNIFSAAGKKLALFEDRLAAWRRGDPVLPVTLEIQVTERCNHYCPSCQARYALPLREVRLRARSGADLDLKLLDSIFDEPPAGVVLSGNTGDPLLHPSITQLLARLRARAMPTVLITNGEAMTPDLAAAIVDTCRGVRISLDADGPAQFVRTHGRSAAAWQRVMDAIALLVAARASRERESCLIGAGFLTDASTRDGMLGATRLVRALGADYIQFRPFHYGLEDVSGEIDRCRDLQTDRFRVWSSQQKYNRLADPRRRYRTCHGTNFYTVVDARGDLYLCCHHVGNPAARYGSLAIAPWSHWMRSVERRACRDGFDVSDCVPLCRLHAHNETLEHNLASGEPIGVSDDEQTRHHAPFL
jgi:MoaA/NifB/PqqE/SkfB family radical SAM enzyme